MGPFGFEWRKIVMSRALLTKLADLSPGLSEVYKLRTYMHVDCIYRKSPK